jgi:preprotein translocase subunit SecE
MATKKIKQEKSKKSKGNFLSRWWRETIGELRKVTWPTPQEAWKLTKVVLVVMVLMSALLGVLDFVFSKIVTAVLA